MEKLENRTVKCLSKPEVVKNLKTILHSSSIFCTVCFDTKAAFFHLDSIVIDDFDGETITAREILETVLGNIQELLMSEYICEACKASAYSSFAFIQETKKTAYIYTKYLNQLDAETLELSANLSGNDWKRAMIVLDGYNDEKEVKKEIDEYVCDICGKEYASKLPLIKHFQKHKAGSIDCLHCKTRPCVHEEYIQNFHEQQRQNLNPIICIRGCKFGQTLTSLIAHVNKEHLDIKNVCKDCGKTFYLESQYKKHIEYHHNNQYACVSCYCKFRSLKLLKHHVTSCGTTDKPFKCEISPVRSESNVTNQVHMATHTSSYSRKESTKKISQNRINKCLICDKVLRTKLELRLHVNKMHEKKPNLCLYCNKQLSSREKYLDHVQSDEHRNNVPYFYRHTCPNCDYSANSQVLIKAHINRVHLNVRPFECTNCQKRYFDSAQLRNHMRTHSDERTLKVCDICGAHLAGPTALKKHRRRHTGENPYSCKHCGLQFNCASHLKVHIMRKHMEPTISCPLCDLKFHTMSNARGHVRKAHWKSKEKFDYTKLNGLSPNDYDFFRDRRKAVL